MYSACTFLHIAYRGQQDNRDKSFQAAHFHNSEMVLNSWFSLTFGLPKLPLKELIPYLHGFYLTQISQTII